MGKFPGVLLLHLTVKFSSARPRVSFEKLTILRNFYMSLNFSLTYPLRSLSALSAQAPALYFPLGSPRSFFSLEFFTVFTEVSLFSFMIFLGGRDLIAHVLVFSQKDSYEEKCLIHSISCLTPSLSLAHTVLDKFIFFISS